MSEAIRRLRSREKLRVAVGAVSIAGVLTLVAALFIEALAWAVGVLSGHPDWLAGWAGEPVTHLLDRLGGFSMVKAWLPTPETVDEWLQTSGMERVAMWAKLIYPPMLVPAAVISPRVVAAYPAETLSQAAPAEIGLQWAGPLGDVQVKAWDGLRLWYQDAGSGAVPFWKPWQTPDMDKALSVAVVTGINGVGKSHLVEAFCQSLDGRAELQACNSRLGRARLGVLRKFRQCLWWRRRSPTDPWDYGYLVEDPARRKRLEQFLPRRPTLLVADELQPASLGEVISDLKRQRANFRHPVRLVVVDSAIPTVLQLVWQADKQVWWTEQAELGEVAVFDLSDVAFRAPQLRALAGAQPGITGQRLRIMGTDAEWSPFVEALDCQPVLLAEAIRFVQDSRCAFEELRADPTPSETLLEHQTGRTPPEQAADIYGIRRDVLRERVLGQRAESRERAIRAVLSEAGKGGGSAYRALLLASFAGGCRPERLRKLMGWDVDELESALLANLFGRGQPAGWVLPFKPAIVVDELLRRYFQAPRGADLRDDQRVQIADFVRCAWCINPAGVLRSAARWRRKRSQDAFTQALLMLPNLADLEVGDGRWRTEIAHAFAELAVLHDGDVALALQAMAALSPAELRTAAPALQALVQREEAYGVPAAILWLQLWAQTWPDASQWTPARTTAFAIELLERAILLVRQIKCSPTPPDEVIDMLQDALDGLLPRFARVAVISAGSADFRVVVERLVEAAWGYGDASALSLPEKLRTKIRQRLLASLLDLPALPDGEPANWVGGLAALLETVVLGDGTTIDAGKWLADSKLLLAPGLPDVPPSVAWARARGLALLVRVIPQDEVASIVQAAERVAQIAVLFPHHEGIQHESAVAWCLLAWAHQDHDPQATAEAAERVGQIAVAFPRHEGIQLASAEAWCVLVWAHKDRDPQATAEAVERVAQIAVVFPRHEGIQHESAKAWRLLVWAYKDRDPQATAAAAERVAQIAVVFPRHEGIQHESAKAWRHLAWAHSDHDPQATAEAAERVAQIAVAFPRHEGIQHESALAWRQLAWAHKVRDPQATAAAGERVAQIAVVFPRHEGIQLESAEAWRYLAWALKGRDPQATAEAVERVAQIAVVFPHHEGIQHESAQAWRYLASALKDRDPQATAAAAERVAQIAVAFPRHEGIQNESAQAWCFLAWALKDRDPQATAAAAERVAQIAVVFPRHEGIQLVSAEAWRLLAWAHQDRDPQATAASAERVGQIAVAFPRHEVIQHESADAWRLLASAHKDRDPQATAEAAERVAQIAVAFPRHEGIQVNCAQAWHSLVRAGAKFDDSAAIERGMAALDAMCGPPRNWANLAKLPEQVFPGVLKERVEAQAVVDAWKQSRQDGGDGTGAPDGRLE